jgi:hypothetical protein
VQDLIAVENGDDVGSLVSIAPISLSVVFSLLSRSHPTGALGVLEDLHAGSVIYLDLTSNE